MIKLLRDRSKDPRSVPAPAQELRDPHKALFERNDEAVKDSQKLVRESKEQIRRMHAIHRDVKLTVEQSRENLKEVYSSLEWLREVKLFVYEPGQE